MHNMFPLPLLVRLLPFLALMSAWLVPLRGHEPAREYIGVWGVVPASPRVVIGFAENPPLHAKLTELADALAEKAREGETFASADGESVLHWGAGVDRTLWIWPPWYRAKETHEVKHVSHLKLVGMGTCLVQRGEEWWLVNLREPTQTVRLEGVPDEVLWQRPFPEYSQLQTGVRISVSPTDHIAAAVGETRVRCGTIRWDASPRSHGRPNSPLSTP